MPIGFARVEFVKRSDGKTACAKSAYNSRSKIEFEGNCVLDPETYNFSGRGDTAYSEVLCPEWADKNFKIASVLWNAVEAKETRLNSQVAIDLVLALPDEKALTLEDRIEIAKTFVEKHFVEEGLAAQIDIHKPDRKITFTEDCEVLGIVKGSEGTVLFEEGDVWKVSLNPGRKNEKVIDLDPSLFSGFTEKEHNWHAHVLITTRRFKPNGKEFEDTKARDLLPQVRGGKVIAGPDWGKLWGNHQNEFFASRGLSLRVDSNGIVPQEHLGPVRMRGRAFAMLEEHYRLRDLNAKESLEPKKILAKIIEKQSVFSRDDVERYLQKYVSSANIEKVREGFWSLGELIRLIPKDKEGHSNEYSALEVVEEEKHILRLADRIQTRSFSDAETFRLEAPQLNNEQFRAYQSILSSQGLVCIQGYAGTGKSYLLAALRETYKEKGYTVRGLGPDNATASVLKSKGFSESENAYRFLFAAHNGRREIKKCKEVWIVDEAGKLGNKPLLELLKLADKNGVKLIFSGDSSQLPPVERGGLFRIFCERYPTEILQDIQRQKDVYQREFAKNLASGEVGVALQKLHESRGISWTTDQRDAIELLMTKWAQETKNISQESTLIIGHTNAEVRALNEMARLIRLNRKEISSKEFEVETAQGRLFVSPGDRIEFRRNDPVLGVENGLMGTLLRAEENKFIVGVSQGEKRVRIVEFDPKEYHAFQLGYASTFYRSQGRTVERAYVLHSPHMCKEMFYVGLTRHTGKAYYFVSKEQVYCLTDLKNQISRTSIKSSTLDFTTSGELSAALEIQARDDRIKTLKTSPRFFDRLKGRSLEVIEKVASKTTDIIEQRNDRLPDREFFSPFTNPDNSLAVVKKVVEREQVASGCSDTVAASQEGDISKETGKHPESLKPLDRKFSFQDVEQELRKNVEPLISRLFPETTIVRGGRDFRIGAKGSLSITHTGDKLGQYYDFERGEGGGLLKLVQNQLGLESSEAKTWAENFLSLDISFGKEALTQIKPSQKNESRTSEWRSVKPPIGIAAPPLNDISKNRLCEFYDEVMRHEYKDKEGGVLYYVLRLQSKDEPSKKITLPLSYGSWGNGSESKKWDLKGYAEDGKKSLYNLDKLYAHPHSKILIVEGEKAADKVLEKFPNKELVCITWPGGAGAVNRADWAPLCGREVIVWPDNDEPGFKAAHEITNYLKIVGAKKIYVMDHPSLFNKLPAKWDLADPWPSEVKAYDIHSKFPGRREDRFISGVLERLKLKTFEEEIRARMILSEYENRKEWNRLEQESDNRSVLDMKELDRKRISEGVEFWNRAQKSSVEMTSNPEISPQETIQKRLAFQVLLYEARKGKSPTLHEVDQMKMIIAETSKSYAHLSGKGETTCLAVDACLAPICQKSIDGKNFDKVNGAQFKKEVLFREAELIRQEEMRNMTLSKVTEKERSIER